MKVSSSCDIWLNREDFHSKSTESQHFMEIYLYEKLYLITIYLHEIFIDHLWIGTLEEQSIPTILQNQRPKRSKGRNFAPPMKEADQKTGK